MKISLVLFAAVVLFVVGADAIKCYQCADCAEPENSAECSSLLYDGCQLTVTSGIKIRSCTSVAACKLVQPQCDGKTNDNCVACCDTDNCNSAGIASFNVFTIFIVSLLSLFFMKQ